jgi:hypothetical protein
MPRAKRGKGLSCKKAQKSNLQGSVSAGGRPQKALALVIIPADNQQEMEVSLTSTTTTRNTSTNIIAFINLGEKEKYKK